MEASVNGEDLWNHLRLHGRSAVIPIPYAINERSEQFTYVAALMKQRHLTFTIEVSTAGIVTTYPSHGLFANEGPVRAARVAASPDRQQLVLGGVDDSRSDNLADEVLALWRSCVYVFKAERLSLSQSPAQETQDLKPNGENLAAALMWLMGNNKVLFERFNNFVTDIFPTIKWVTVVPLGNSYDIKLWSIDPGTMKNNLTVRLAESGTGIGQVLAILYVAMTRPPSTIVIDEPNSFLHPGAAKKLIQILRRHPQHQYVIATHSPDLITAVDPPVIHFVRWSDGESKIDRIGPDDVRKLRDVLSDVGASRSYSAGG